MSDKTTIQIRTETRDALKEIGNMGDTYDHLIQEMIYLYKNIDR